MRGEFFRRRNRRCWRGISAITALISKQSGDWFIPFVYIAGLYLSLLGSVKD
jgi:hypothetical protein